MECLSAFPEDRGPISIQLFCLDYTGSLALAELSIGRAKPKIIQIPACPGQSSVSFPHHGASYGARTDTVRLNRSMPTCMHKAAVLKDAQYCVSFRVRFVIIATSMPRDATLCLVSPYRKSADV